MDFYFQFQLFVICRGGVGGVFCFIVFVYRNSIVVDVDIDVIWVDLRVVGIYRNFCFEWIIFNNVGFFSLNDWEERVKFNYMFIGQFSYIVDQCSFGVFCIGLYLVYKWEYSSKGYLMEFKVCLVVFVFVCFLGFVIDIEWQVVIDVFNMVVDFCFFQIEGFVMVVE